MQGHIQPKADSVGRAGAKKRGVHPEEPNRSGPIEVLRRQLVAELQEYGALLVTLEGQREAIRTQSPAAILRSVSDFEAQMQRTNEVCAQRQRLQNDLALSVNQAADAPFSALSPVLPCKYRPALRALMMENDNLRVRIQKIGRQNQLLLARSLELIKGLTSNFGGPLSFS